MPVHSDPAQDIFPSASYVICSHGDKKPLLGRRGENMIREGKTVKMDVCSTTSLANNTGLSRKDTHGKVHASWNKVPPKISSSESIVTFKSRLKKYLFVQYYNSTSTSLTEAPI